MAGIGSRAGRDGSILTSVFLQLFGTCVAVDGDHVHLITIVLEFAAQRLALPAGDLDRLDPAGWDATTPL
jgi:hypothetical protein